MGLGNSKADLMISVEIDILRHVIEAHTPSAEAQMLYKDAFALGCYLHRAGHKNAGLTLCQTVVDALESEKNKTAFAHILSTLEGNEGSYAAGVIAHNEINALFEH